VARYEVTVRETTELWVWVEAESRGEARAKARNRAAWIDWAEAPETIGPPRVVSAARAEDDEREVHR
jgi:hypothetical protein